MRLHVVISIIAHNFAEHETNITEKKYQIFYSNNTHTRHAYCGTFNTRFSHLRFFFLLSSFVLFFIVIMLGSSMCSFCSLLCVFSNVLFGIVFFFSFIEITICVLYLWMDVQLCFFYIYLGNYMVTHYGN